MKKTTTIPNTSFVIGQRVYCQPLGEEGDIVGYENDGFILIIDLVQGGAGCADSAGDRRS